MISGANKVKSLTFFVNMSKMLSPKELLAGESAGVNLTFKSLEEKSFDDDESQGDDSESENEDDDSDNEGDSSDGEDHANGSNPRSSHVRSVDKTDQVRYIKYLCVPQYLH